MFNAHRYTFEFSRAPQAFPLLTQPGLIALALAIFCLVFVWMDFNQVKQSWLEQQAQQQTIQNLKVRARITKKPALTAKSTLPKPLLNNIATIKKQIDLQWFALLNAFETAQLEDVTLTQMLPNADKSTFSITGEAKNYAILLKYIHRLEETTSLSNVHLISHEVNETHPQHPIVFEVEGEWQT